VGRLGVFIEGLLKRSGCLNFRGIYKEFRSVYGVVSSIYRAVIKRLGVVFTNTV